MFYWFVIVLFLLLFAAVWLVTYVVVPAAVLGSFFRSAWVPRGIKHVVGCSLGVGALLAVGAFGWRENLRKRARRQAVLEARMPFIRLTVQQPGLRPYPLGRGRIEVSPHDSAQRLVVSGDLPDGQRLRARFTSTRGVGAYFETNAVAVCTDAGAATQATGQSFYAPDSQTVRGAFRCVLPSGQHLSVSFPSTPLARY